MELYVETDEAMQLLGQRIAPFLSAGDVVYLQGELGAGKTTLVRGIARGMGYAGRVTSPTFTIMNIYPNEPDIYHFDFYRLDHHDLPDLGLDDYLSGEGVVLIEWPEIGMEFLPEEAMVIEISLIDDDYERGRKVQLMPRGLYFVQKIEEIEKQCSF